MNETAISKYEKAIEMLEALIRLSPDHHKIKWYKEMIQQFEQRIDYFHRSSVKKILSRPRHYYLLAFRATFFLKSFEFTVIVIFESTQDMKKFWVPTILCIKMMEWVFHIRVQSLALFYKKCKRTELFT